MLQLLLVQIRVKPQFVDAFKTATIANASGSIQEPGVVRFDFFQHKDDPTRFVLHEIYKQENDIAAHRETAHFKKWLETVSDMFDGERTREFYHNVHPGDDGWQKKQ